MFSLLSIELCRYSRALKPRASASQTVYNPKGCGKPQEAGRQSPCTTSFNEIRVSFFSFLYLFFFFLHIYTIDILLSHHINVSTTTSMKEKKIHIKPTNG